MSRRYTTKTVADEIKRASRRVSLIKVLLRDRQKVLHRVVGGGGARGPGPVIDVNGNGA